MKAEIFLWIHQHHMIFSIIVKALQMNLSGTHAIIEHI